MCAVLPFQEHAADVSSDITSNKETSDDPEDCIPVLENVTGDPVSLHFAIQ